MKYNNAVVKRKAYTPLDIISSKVIRMRKSKAQVGIGTLIVFIAMILVAAVAAGTVLRTSGILEFKARMAGETAAKEVSTNLKVVDVVGYASRDCGSSTATEITKLIITTALAPGSSSIRYDDIILGYQAGNVYLPVIRYNSSIVGTECGYTTNNNRSDFGIVQLVNVTGDQVLERGELVEIHFWVENGTTAANSANLPLQPNQEFFITLMPLGSTPLEYGRVAPSGISTLYVKKWG